MKIDRYRKKKHKTIGQMQANLQNKTKETNNRNKKDNTAQKMKPN